MLEVGNAIAFGYDSIEEAFPLVDAGIEPLGSRVLVQLRAPKKKTKGGIILTADTRQTEYWNTHVARVLAVGPVAFRDRKTMDPWPEGAWVEPNDFVCVPQYGGVRWSVTTGHGDEEDQVIVALFNDLDLTGKVLGDPLAVRAFV